MIDNLIVEAAIEEITVKNLGVTQQFFESHRIAYINDKPQIASIVKDSNDVASVYFNVENEKFYFRVYVDLHPSVNVKSATAEACHSISFIARSDQHSMADLSALTTLIPSKGFNKDDTANNKKLRKESCIILEASGNADEFKNKLTQLLNYLEQDKPGVATLVKQAKCYISVASSFHNGNTMLGGFHINAEQIKRLSDLNLAIDFDIYADGNLFEECI